MTQIDNQGCKADYHHSGSNRARHIATGSPMTLIVRLSIYTVVIFASATAFGDSGGSQEALKWNSPLVLVQCAWLVLIAIGAPVYSALVGNRNGGSTSSERRGLNLPRGSIRSLLALLAVGSFLNVMVLGAPVLQDNFEKVLTAFSALTGSIIGFYFGARTSAPPPPNNSSG